MINKIECIACGKTLSTENFYFRKYKTKIYYRNPCKLCWNTNKNRSFKKFKTLDEKETKRKQTLKLYRNSLQGKLSKLKYNISEKAKIASQKYNKSVEGRLRNKKYRENHPDVYRFHARKRHANKKLIMENYTPLDEKITKIIFGNNCFNCESVSDIEIDHHYPLSKGFALTLLNAVPLCRKCNSSKGNKTPKEFYSTEKLNRIEWLHAMLEK